MSEKVLVVDDDDDVRQLISIRLETAGYQVRDVNCGEDALKEVERDPPDLILLDIMMPRMDGYEVCQKIREAGHQVKIIFLSAKSEDWDLLQGYGEGGDSYLVKPVMVETLLDEIKKVLNRSKKFSA